MTSASSVTNAALESTLNALRAEAPHVDREARWPEKSVSALADAGFLALTLPKEIGGGGASMRSSADTIRRLASACGSTAMIYLMHVCAAQVIAAARHQGGLEAIAEGKALATLAFSEKGSRSHFWAPVSRAQMDNRWIKIDAEKSFVTSAGAAALYVVSSGAVGGATPMDSTLYVVEQRTRGVDVSGKWSGLGLRGNASAPMTFKCQLQESARLTPEGGGFKAMMEIVLPWFQAGSAAVSLGIAEAALADTTRHVSTARLEHIGQSLAEAVPGIRARLARMRLTLDSGSAYLDQTLKKVEAQDPDAMLAILGVKAVAAESAISVTDEALRACGGAAFAGHLSVERCFRDARAASIMAPTTDVLHDFIGKAVAGLPLF